MIFRPDTNWIREEKWILSQAAGHDVGVPRAVDSLIRKGADGFDLRSRSRLIVNYLVHEEPLQDSDGQDQLIGELKRYGARFYDISPLSVEVTPELIDSYAETHFLSDHARRTIIDKISVPEKNLILNLLGLFRPRSLNSIG